MGINVEKLKRLNDLVSLAVRKKNIIVLNPAERENEKKIGSDIIYDKADWKITEEFSTYVKELSEDDTLSIEDKILSIYEKICKDYVYDDNLISYIKKVDDDVFSLPDWYGRDIDEEWESNRESHKRRVCYELSRYSAKALTELLKDNDDYNVCIHWNKDLTHYFVGLSCSEYSVILDPDDFFNIKDLTRLKAGLNTQGIKILEDPENKFKNALDKFNEGKSEYAINKIKDEIENDNSIQNSSENEKINENEDIIFLNNVIKILSEKYKLDSQGIYEYLKEIVDIKLGSESREKIWKRIDGDDKESTRYIRCLLIKTDEQESLIDVDERKIRPFDREEFKMKKTKFIPYNELSRGGYDYYNGR